MANTISTTDATTIEEVLARKCQCPQVVDSVDFINTHPGCPGDIEDIEDIVGALDYHQPVGKHICELEDASKMFQNDLLLVSQLSGRSWTSRKTTFARLKTQLLADLVAGLKLGSMAYEDKFSWALTSHNHNTSYNLVEWHPNPDYRPNTSEEASRTSCLAVIHLSTEQLETTDIYSNPSQSNIKIEHLSVNVPKIESPLPPEPLVGTLRFISTRCLQDLIDANALNVEDGQVNVNPYDGNGKIRDDFDGWVFPNGQQFQNKSSQLSDAAFVFAGDYNATSFTVPTLTSFFQAGYSVAGYTIAEIPQTIGLANHQHETSEIQLKCNIKFNSSKTQISSTSGCGGTKYVHQGNKTSGASSTVQGADVDTPVKFKDTITGLHTDSAGTGSKEYWPKHNLIPVMVYIGGVTRDYYEHYDQTGSV